MRSRALLSCRVTPAVSLSSLAGLTSASAVTTRTTSPTYYVNLGDSYAEGYQPGVANNSETLHGYADQLVAVLKHHGHFLTLENFGCGGATTGSLLHTNGCSASPLNGPSYPTTTQLAAVLSFLAAHAGHIGLVTLTIGGNDFDGCAGQPPSCLTNAMPGMQSDIQTISADLRAAVGPKVPILSLTYPDVILGTWVFGASFHALAQQSVTAFKTVINPTYVAAYAGAHVSFVDATAATGAYRPLTTTVLLAPYGHIPVAVANVCKITWFCVNHDIHPRTVGYGVLARLLATRYLKLVP